MKRQRELEIEPTVTQLMQSFRESVADLQQSTAHVAEDDRLVRQAREHHRFMFGLSVVVIVASFLLRHTGDEAVCVRGLGFQLPPLCGSRAWFNVECPGCGLTRSFVTLAAGDLAASLHQHRLGWLMALAVVAQIPYRWFVLKELRQTGPVERRWPTWFGWGLIGLLIANWILKGVGL